MTCGRFVAGLYGKHSQGLTLAPPRAKAELSCLHLLEPPYTSQIRRRLKNENIHRPSSARQPEATSAQRCFRKMTRKLETYFFERFSEVCPETHPEMFSWQVDRLSPKCHQFFHQIFRALNQISSQNCKTHGSPNGALQMGTRYLSTIVHDCQPIIGVIFRQMLPLQKATNVHNGRRLCTYCREWPYHSKFPLGPQMPCLLQIVVFLAFKIFISVLKRWLICPLQAPQRHAIQNSIFSKGVSKTRKFVVCSFFCECCKFGANLSWHSPQHLRHSYLHQWDLIRRILANEVCDLSPSLVWKNIFLIRPLRTDAFRRPEPI